MPTSNLPKGQDTFSTAIQLVKENEKQNQIRSPTIDSYVFSRINFSTSLPRSRFRLVTQCFSLTKVRRQKRLRGRLLLVNQAEPNQAKQNYVHTILGSFPCRHEKLSSMHSMNSLTPSTGSTGAKVAGKSRAFCSLNPSPHS